MERIQISPKPFGFKNLLNHFGFKDLPNHGMVLKISWTIMVS